MSLSSCLMILNYNGKDYLRTCLPSALEASRSLGESCPVVVVDNQSTEGDIPFIHKNFPAVEVFSARSNDMLFSLNEAVSKRSEEIVVILNNDMRFEINFINPLLKNFQDSEVFAVSARVLDWEGRETTIAKRIAYFRHFWFYKKWDFGPRTSCWSLDAGGGCSAFRRKMFLELGGFDRLYYPAYCEDTDLSYRAWKRGWKVRYEPNALIYHKSGATLNSLHGREKIACLICRNEILFTVKNCKGNLFVLFFLVFLPVKFIQNIFLGNHFMVQGILDAIGKIPEALIKRFAQKPFVRVKDEVFLQRIMQNAD